MSPVGVHFSGPIPSSPSVLLLFTYLHHTPAVVPPDDAIAMTIILKVHSLRDLTSSTPEPSSTLYCVCLSRFVLLLSAVFLLPQLSVHLQALHFKHLITAVGLDSAEIGWPPSQFKAVYAHAAAQGFKLVAHAGLLLALERLCSSFTRAVLVLC